MSYFAPPEYSAGDGGRFNQVVRVNRDIQSAILKQPFDAPRLFLNYCHTAKFSLMGKTLPLAHIGHQPVPALFKQFWRHHFT
jgi:hypothetical protein